MYLSYKLASKCFQNEFKKNYIHIYKTVIETYNKTKPYKYKYISMYTSLSGIHDTMDINFDINQGKR